MKRIVLIGLLLASAANAQQDTSWRDGDRMAGTITTSPQGQAIAPKVVIISPAGTAAPAGTSGDPIYTTSSGGSGTPTGPAGTPNANVVTVQGINGGTAQNVQGTGAAGTPATGVLTIQGIAGGVAQAVSNAGTFAVQNTAATPTGTNSIGTVGLNAGSNAIGSITNTTFAATQATAANLNATVVGTGTFATQVTSSALPTGAATAANQTNGTQTTGLVAGSAIIGNVRIDQTTPGTTNGVVVNALTLRAGYDETAGSVAFTAGQRIDYTARAIPAFASFYQATAYCSQACTIYINSNLAGGGDQSLATVGITAGSVGSLSASIAGGASTTVRTVIIYGGTGGNAQVVSAFRGS